MTPAYVHVLLRHTINCLLLNRRRAPALRDSGAASSTVKLDWSRKLYKLHVYCYKHIQELFTRMHMLCYPLNRILLTLFLYPGQVYHCSEQAQSIHGGGYLCIWFCILPHHQGCTFMVVAFFTFVFGFVSYHTIRGVCTSSLQIPMRVFIMTHLTIITYNLPLYVD